MEIIIRGTVLYQPSTNVEEWPIRILAIYQHFLRDDARVICYMPHKSPAMASVTIPYCFQNMTHAVEILSTVKDLASHAVLALLETNDSLACSRSICTAREVDFAFPRMGSITAEV